MVYDVKRDFPMRADALPILWKRLGPDFVMRVIFLLMKIFQTFSFYLRFLSEGRSFYCLSWIDSLMDLLAFATRP